MIRPLLLFIQGILLIILLLFLLILFFRLVYFFKERNEARRSAIWEPVLLFYLHDLISLQEAATSLGPPYPHLFNFLTPYLKNIRGKEGEKLQELMEATGLTDYFLKKIRQGRLKERVRAARVLGILGDTRALPDLKALLSSPDSQVAFIAAQALSYLGDRNMLIPVIRTILSRTPTTFEGATGLTVRFGPEISPHVLDLIARWKANTLDLEEVFGVPPFQSLSLLLDILGHHQYLPGMDLYQSLLQEDEHPEILIHLFKLLKKLEYPVKVDLKPFLQHSDWVIRSQASRLVGSIQDNCYQKELTGLLADENWWVRYHAGRALLELGEETLLQEISSSSGEGAKMSRYILSQEGRSLQATGRERNTHLEGKEPNYSGAFPFPADGEGKGEAPEAGDDLQGILQSLAAGEERFRHLLATVAEWIPTPGQRDSPFIMTLDEMEESRSHIQALLEKLATRKRSLEKGEGEEEAQGAGIIYQKKLLQLEDLLLEGKKMAFNTAIFAVHLEERGRALEVMAHSFLETFRLLFGSLERMEILLEEGFFSPGVREENLFPGIPAIQKLTSLLTRIQLLFEKGRQEHSFLQQLLGIQHTFSLLMGVNQEGGSGSVHSLLEDLDQLEKDLTSLCKHPLQPASPPWREELSSILEELATLAPPLLKSFPREGRGRMVHPFISLQEELQVVETLLESLVSLDLLVRVELARSVGSGTGIEIGSLTLSLKEIVSEMMGLLSTHQEEDRRGSGPLWNWRQKKDWYNVSGLKQDLEEEIGQLVFTGEELVRGGEGSWDREWVTREISALQGEISGVGKAWQRVYLPTLKRK